MHATNWIRSSQCCDIVRDDVIVHIQCKICLERKKNALE